MLLRERFKFVFVQRQIADKCRLAYEDDFTRVNQQISYVPIEKVKVIHLVFNSLIDELTILYQLELFLLVRLA
jgi:hypothetical protein